MAKVTQKQRILEILKRDGSISRNQALGMFISRLSAIIQDLEAEGYSFVPKKKDGDYTYTLVGSPKRKVSTFIPTENGTMREVVTYA